MPVLWCPCDIHNNVCSPKNVLEIQVFTGCFIFFRISHLAQNVAGSRGTLRLNQKGVQRRSSSRYSICVCIKKKTFLSAYLIWPTRSVGWLATSAGGLVAARSCCCWSCSRRWDPGPAGSTASVHYRSWSRSGHMTHRICLHSNKHIRTPDCRRTPDSSSAVHVGWEAWVACREYSARYLRWELVWRMSCSAQCSRYFCILPAGSANLSTPLRIPDSSF